MGIQSGFRRHLLLAAVILTCTAAAGAEAPTYTEDFTTTEFRDGAHTTALWDTAAGEIRLYPFQTAEVGFLDTGTAMDVVFAGGFAYVADYSNGLCIVDLTDPEAPSQIGQFSTSGNAYGVALAGNVAYVADYGAGLVAVDITDPEAPVLLGSYNTPGYAQAVVLAGNYAFVADGSAGVIVVDISNPASPVYAGSQDTPSSAVHLARAGDLLFVADSSSGVQVMDVTSPAAPMILGYYNTPGSARGLAVDGNWLYVADYTNGLLILDVADPTLPVLVGTIDTPGYANRVALSGDLAYVADQSQGLFVADVSNRAAPQLVESFDTPGSSYAQALGAEHLYLADGTSGLRILKVRNAGNPVALVGNPWLAEARSVAVCGDYAFLAFQETIGFVVYDVSDPVSPAFVTRIDTPGEPHDVVIDGKYAYLADGTYGLQVFDISTPTSPVRIGGVVTPGEAYAIVVAGDYAFLASHTSSLTVVDISEPNNPIYVGSYGPSGGSAVQLALAGNILYVADFILGLYTWDVSDPTHPVTIGGMMINYVYNLAVYGDYLIIATCNNYLRILDISDPGDPQLLSSYYGEEYQATLAVSVAGDFAFVSDTGVGLEVLDLANPMYPVPVGRCPLGAPQKAMIHGNLAYVPDRNLGLAVMEVFSSEFDLKHNRAQSVDIHPIEVEVARARLQSTQVGEMAWQLSADGGVHWQNMVPDGTAEIFAYTGTSLRWRADLLRSQAGVNPTASSLQVDWFYAGPLITSVTDIPNDQGRQVRVEWTRSGHDFLGDPSQIAEYAVYRKIDDPAKAVWAADLPEELSVIARESALAMASVGWDWVATVPARLQDGYAVVAPTLADSTITDGLFLSTFLVSALAAVPGVFFDSFEESGYSLDNLAPNVPEEFQVEYGPEVSLSWEPSTDDDFRYFKIYRGDEPDFPIDPAQPLHTTTLAAWTDPEGGYGSFYKLSAVDFAGNESPAASPGSVSGTAGQVPVRTLRVLQNTPNPFNPRTVIAFDLPRRAEVRLRIHDVAGRLVRTLLPGLALGPGPGQAVWDGTDDSGAPVAAGVYFYTLEAGREKVTRRMALVK